MKQFELQDAIKAAQELGIDFEKVGYTPEEFLAGMNVEIEHGLVDPHTNVTSDDPLTTAKIALAHLNENELYYNEDIGLEAWEHALDDVNGYTKGKKIIIM